MQFILSLLGFFFLLVTIGMGILVWNVRRRMKSIRDAMQDSMEDEEFLRKADKHYYKKKANTGVEFDEEYFKGDPNRDRNKQQSRQERKSQSTTFTASNGVTIIDGRDAKARKKMFAQDEGEYVDFKEE